MAKGSNGRMKTPKKSQTAFSDSDMDDEIDVFHKQRDVVPLDLDNDALDSDEDNDQHVFQIEDDSDDEIEDEDDSEEDTGFAAKIAKQHKSLKAKIGGAVDETQDDAEEEEEQQKALWGPGKNIYYVNDKKGESESSDEEKEEEEVLRLQSKKTKLYSNTDLGLEDDSEEEPTFEENLSKGKLRSKATVGHDGQDETDTEVVMKDPSALSKEEQMDVVFNSAPELVGLLPELNEAVEQLETKVDPILIKLKEEKNINKSAIQYMEVKKQLLLSYCQAITFHLLLKSEGQHVRDHPVLARLVEIKNLLDKMKPLDVIFSFEIEDFLKKSAFSAMDYSPKETAALESVSLINNFKTVEQKEPLVATKLLKIDSKTENDKRGKRNRQNEQLGLQSVRMLKVRAALEEKLKQNGVYNLKTTKNDVIKKNLKPLNGKLEALDDFDDDTFDNEGNKNKSNIISSNRLSQLVTQKKKPRVISGDDDLPKRDDIGERRRQHEMRVLASAGIQSDDDDLQDHKLDADEVNGTDEDGDTDSESDLYKEIKLKHDAKVAAKAQKYSRMAPSFIAAPETNLDGKRHINYEMDKNRGLTRKRNKDLKNPRKKYKLKHKKKEIARDGQIRKHRKQAGPYGGEVTGINTISTSIRFKG